jgi:hypothetical protein
MVAIETEVTAVNKYKGIHILYIIKYECLSL